MKRHVFSFSLCGWILATSLQAATVNGVSVSRASLGFDVVNAGELLDLVTFPEQTGPGVYWGLAAPDITATVDSSIDAADATLFEDSQTYLDAFEAPYGTLINRSTTRNDGTEGGAAQNETINWDYFDPIDDIFIDRFESNGQSQVQVSTDPVEAQARSDTLRQRDFWFRNQSFSPFVLVMSGYMDVTASTNFSGESGHAEAYTTTSLQFESTDSLDMTFSGLGPFAPMTDMNGDGAQAELNRVIDTDNGFFSLEAFSRVDGIDPLGSGFGVASGRQDFLFSITLRPFETVSMRMAVTHHDIMRANPDMGSVPLPGALLFLGSWVIALCACRRRA